MTVRLCNASLDQFSAATRPGYDRRSVKPGIVHIGIGNFHRAHQAVYTDDVLQSGDYRWGIVGASLRSETMQYQLAPQNWLYTLSIHDRERIKHRVIGAIQEVLTLARQRNRLINLIASPEIKVVTLTITEKGYCLDENSDLDLNHTDIRNDIRQPALPVSAPGLIAEGLRRRQHGAAGPISIISCDNLGDNGGVTERVLERLLTEQGSFESGWLQDNVTFPGTMVDRIVPQTTADARAGFTKETGMIDEGLVICEPFSQWVIEDRFAGERPAWESAGAQLTDNVATWETAKLRLLNASHSALAYLGLLAGYEFIHEAVADPLLAGFVRRMLDQEVSPVIEYPPQLDLNAYRDQILERFANPAIPYRTAQVATDGSKKLPQRVFPTIMECREQGLECPGLCLVVAAWLRCRADSTTASRFSDPDTEFIAEYGGPDLLSHVVTDSTLLGPVGNENTLSASINAALSSLEGDLATAVRQLI